MSATAAMRFDSARTAVNAAAGSGGMQSSYTAMPGQSASELLAPSAPAMAAAARPGVPDQSMMGKLTAPAASVPSPDVTPFSSLPTPDAAASQAYGTSAEGALGADAGVSGAPLAAPAMKTSFGSFKHLKSWTLSRKITALVVSMLALAAVGFFLFTLLSRKPAPPTPQPAPVPQELLVRLERGSTLELQGLPSSKSMDKSDVAQLQSSLNEIEKSQKSLGDLMARQRGDVKEDTTARSAPPAPAPAAGAVRYSADLATTAEAPDKSVAQKQSSAGDAKWSSTKFYGAPRNEGPHPAAASSVQFSTFAPRKPPQQV